MRNFSELGLSKSVVIVIVGLVGIIVISIGAVVMINRGKVKVPANNTVTVPAMGEDSQPEVVSENETPRETRKIEGLGVRRQLTEDELTTYGFFAGSTVYATPTLDSNGTLYMNFEVVSAPLDSDKDGLTDEQEADFGTDPNNPDTDGDGLSDMSEKTLGTNPLKTDTDGDGYSDGEEVEIKRDPNNYSR